MKSQNQTKYFLNTNVDAYGITKGNIVMYVVAIYICIKYLNFGVFQGQIFLSFFLLKSFELHLPHIRPECSISQVIL